MIEGDLVYQLHKEVRTAPFGLRTKRTPLGTVAKDMPTTIFFSGRGSVSLSVEPDQTLKIVP